MRNYVIILLLFCSVLSFSSLQAQAPETPLEYLEYLSSRDQQMAEKYLSYMSEVAHGHRARKMEKRRQALLTEIKQSLSDANKLRPYKGDAALRDAYRHYWDVLYKVFNEDYSKIVNMEEIAEQSYDEMEAYLAAQQKAGEVLNDAQDQVEPIYHSFAENNNIRIIERESKMNVKLRQVGAVTKYKNVIFLIFFKSNRQEKHLLEAFNKHDLNGTEQSRITLEKYATEGLAKLDTIKPYNGDGSLITACRKVLEFHKNEAVKSMPQQTDFLVKSSEFEKIKKAMDAKPASSRTQQDIDAYNKSVNEMNASIKASNSVLTADNNVRDKVINNWNITEQNFMDSHIPHGK